MKFITTKELDDLRESFNEIVNDLNCENPLQVIAFATTLINMGNFVMSKTNSRLILKSYSKQELYELNSVIKEQKKYESSK